MFKARYIPNIISLWRIGLVWPFVQFLLQQRFEIAFWLFLIAGLSDALDGFLARTFDWRSYLGAVLDPLADKLLLISAYLSLSYLGLLPAWLASLVVGRDLIILLGAGLYRYCLGELTIQPTGLSKLNTSLQIILIAGWLYSLAFDWSIPYANTLLILVGLSTVSSGLDYVLRWSIKAWRSCG